VDYLALNPAMAGGQGGPGLEPNILLAAIARETQRIGLVATHSTTFNPPYIVARQIQSLHWLSQGRAGWNIVTSIEGAENFGDAPMPPPEARYRKAAELSSGRGGLPAPGPPHRPCRRVLQREGPAQCARP
jgi:alkanesulfonate monooxygenase SsuD/methylene tetrahydromethanopterin reductase-like flavin-dependent oxidoreductase (luciferase family)